MSSAGIDAAGHVEQLRAVRPLQRHDVLAELPDGVPGHPPAEQRELGEVLRRSRPERLEVAPEQVLHGPGVRLPSRRPRPRSGDERRPQPERPRPAGRRVVQRRERPERPPRTRVSRSEVPLDHRLDLGLRVRLRQEVEQAGEQGVDVRDRQACLREPAVVQARGAQAAHHRVVEGRVVLGVHGVQRDADQRRLHHGPFGEGGVQVGRVEIREPVPQPDVGRSGLLRLQCRDSPDGVDHIQPLAAQEQLAAERGPVELPGGECHAAILPERRISHPRPQCE